jgi:hypothetical protein
VLFPPFGLFEEESHPDHFPCRAILACQRDEMRVVTSASRSMELAIKEISPEIQKIIASGIEEHAKKIDNMVKEPPSYAPVFLI